MILVSFMESFLNDCACSRVSRMAQAGQYCMVACPAYHAMHNIQSSPSSSLMSIHPVLAVIPLFE